MNHVRNLATAMAAVRAQFTSAMPEGLTGGSLWAPQGRALISGSSVPAVVGEFVERASGFLVPRSCADEPQPLDLAVRYLTAQETLGAKLPLDWVEDQLRRLPVEDVLGFTATVLAAAYRPGLSRPDLDAHFADQWLAEPNRTRVQNIMRDRSRVLVVPQMVHVLLKLALHLSPDAIPTNLEPGRPHAVLLALPDLLQDPTDGARSVITGPADRLTRELAANQLFNARPDAAALIGRAAERWLEMPQEMRDHPRVVDLEAAYWEATGVGLRDVMAVACVLYASTINGSPRVRSDFLRPMGMSPEAERAVLDTLVADIETLRAAVRDEVSAFGWSWSANSVGQYPVVRMSNGDLLVLDAGLLLHRAFGRLPLFDIRKKSGDACFYRAARALDHLAETQALDAVMNGVDGPKQSRVFTETDLQQVPGRRTAKACDAAVDYGDSWVLLEVTTTHLKRESVAGLPGAHLDEDLNKLVPKARQIHEAIETLRLGQEHLTGAPATPSTRYFPVLVLAEGFPVNPATMTLVRERVESAGLLAESDVAPLEILDMEDLEVVESLLEQGGPSLLDLLRSKQDHNLRNVGLKDYVLIGLGYHVKRPKRLAAKFSETFEEVVRRLNPDARQADSAAGAA